MAKNNGQAVYVLGDTGTTRYMSVLKEKAGESGAVITRTFTFDPGEACRSDDLSRIDAVVDALEWSITTRSEVWVPFWQQDLGREQHLRTLALTLQRHNLNLLLGPTLAPYRGFTALDVAIGAEVRAVLNLDAAAMAASGTQFLGDEINAFLRKCTPVPAPVDEDPGERRFTTAEAAVMLGKTRNWLTRGLRAKVFAYADGSRVEALRPGAGGRLALTAPMVHAIAWSALRRGALTIRRFERVVAELDRHD